MRKFALIIGIGPDIDDWANTKMNSFAITDFKTIRTGYD